MTRLIDFEVKLKYNKNKEIPKKVFNFFDRYVKCGVWGAPARQYIKRRKGTGRGAVKAFRIGKLAYQNEYGYEYTVKKDVIIDDPRNPKIHYKIKAGTSIKVPARPAFRNMATSKNHLNKIGKAAQNAVSRLLKGGSPRSAWKIIGDSALEEIRASYTSRKFDSNSPLTVALKGVNFPLVDTYGVYNALHYKILSGSKETAKAEKKAWNKKVRLKTDRITSRLRGE